MNCKIMRINNFVFVNILFLTSMVILVNSVHTDRRKILSNNFIKNINRKQKYWIAGRNFHKDSELKNLINVSTFKRKFTVDTKDNIELVNNIPETFDSREHWSHCNSIKSVKTQGNCASSYAIVPASVFTDRLCIQKNIQRNNSADQLLSCCRKCGGGCFGGHVEKSFIYMRDVGLITGGDYNSRDGCRPYKIPKCPLRNNLPFCRKIRKITPSCYYLKCTNERYKNATYALDKLKMKNIYGVPPDINAIKSEIIKNGPVSASIIIHEDFFNYKSGVYYHTTGSKIGKHEVKLIGWGTSNKLKPYWLAVNSWGKEWGNKGMFKILQGINECGIESNILAGNFIK